MRAWAKEGMHGFHAVAAEEMESRNTDILGAVASTLLLYGSQRQALGNLSCYSERQLFKLWREYVI